MEDTDTDPTATNFKQGLWKQPGRMKTEQGEEDLNPFYPPQKTPKPSPALSKDLGTANRREMRAEGWQSRGARQSSLSTNYCRHYLHRLIRFSLINSAEGGGGRQREQQQPLRARQELWMKHSTSEMQSEQLGALAAAVALGGRGDSN